MKKHLKKLAHSCLLLQEKELAYKIGQLLEDLPTNPGGEIPTFDWLLDGKIFSSIFEQNKHLYEQFIDLNSEILSQFDITRYLSSGEVGDAWLLDDGTVLKIFKNVTMNDLTDREKYEDVQKKLFQGKGSTNLPMVYQIGDFKMPTLLQYYDKNLKLDYVIMEKVDSFPAKMNDYMFENEERFRFRDQDDELYRPINSENISPTMGEVYQQPLLDSINQRNYGENFKKFLVFNLDSFIGDIINDYESEDRTPKFNKDLEKSLFRKTLSAKIVRQVKNSYLDLIETISNLFGFPKDWDFKLGHAIIENLYHNRYDLHPGNFGFRNNEIVFYDG